MPRRKLDLLDEIMTPREPEPTPDRIPKMRRNRRDWRLFS